MQNQKIDKPLIPQRWIIVLAVCLAVCFLIELTYKKHPHVEYENWFGFYGWAAACATLIMSLVGLLFRPLLWRAEDYYDG